MDPETRVKLLDIAVGLAHEQAPADIPRRLGFIRAYYRHLAATVGVSVEEIERADDKATEDALGQP